MRPIIVELGGGVTADDLSKHDETDFYKAQSLVRMFDDPQKSGGHFPRPFGGFYQTERACYEDIMEMQV